MLLFIINGLLAINIHAYDIEYVIMKYNKYYYNK